MSDRSRKTPFEVVYPHTAGIDLGSTRHFVAVPYTEDGEDVRSFGCFTADLLAMGEWLRAHRVEHVAMESTGVYWVPVYEALSALGFKVALVDARSVKALPGRKSDVKDCQWVRDLYAHGLVSPCAVPDAEGLALRSYWRQRGRLVEQRAEQIQLMHKALEQMNVQLHKVLSDVTGVSGMAIIRAVLSGERDPAKLAQLVHAGVKASKTDIARALEGTWSPHHLFALQQAVESYDFFGQKLMDCDARIDEQLRVMAGSGGPSSDIPKRGKPRKNQPSFDAHQRVKDLLKVDPTVIDGLDAMTVLTLISELGVDLSRYPKEKNLTSRLGLCPQNQITGGRIKRGHTKKVANRASTALRVAAQSLHHSSSALGAFFRRMKAKHGPKKAITATARKLAVLYYRLVRHGILYEDPGADAYKLQLQEQQRKRLDKQAKRLGLRLTPIPAPLPEQVVTFS